MTTPTLDVARPLTPVARQTSTDQQLVELWLHGRSRHTQRAYRADIARFLTFVATPLASVTLGDVQAFSDSLTGLAPSSKTRALAKVKSPLAFAQRTGYLPLNVGAAVKLQQSKDKLAERISAALGSWLLERALEHDKPMVLFHLACQWLLQEHLVRPGVTLVERLVAGTRERFQDETYRRLTSLLTPALRDGLDAFTAARGRHRPNTTLVAAA